MYFCAEVKSLLLLFLASVSSCQQHLVRRFATFRTLPGFLLSTKFMFKQIRKFNQIHCVKKCLLDKKCLSLAYGNLLCFLYSTDPRALLDEKQLIKTNKSSMRMCIILKDFEMPCFVGKIPAQFHSDLEKCGFEEKMADSNCIAWSDWKLVSETFCDGGANFIRWRTRDRNCTQPLFGGRTWDCYERLEKIPLLLDHYTTTFDEATGFCNQQERKKLFTGSL